MAILSDPRDRPGMQVDERWWEDGRHDILDEVDRDDVMAMIVDWTTAKVA